jgi:GntR family transcriptional regulator
MAADLGIAIGTLRKALAALEARGMLERIQGSGNYVRVKPDIGNVYTFFRLELVEGGGLPTASVLDAIRLGCPEEAKGFSSKTAHRIRRLRYLDTREIAIEEIWLDGKFIRTLQASDLLDSLYYYYTQSFGLIITKVEDRVGVSEVPDWSPEEFKRQPGESVGYIERMGFDQNGAPAEFSKTWFDPSVALYTNRLR